MTSHRRRFAEWAKANERELGLVRCTRSAHASLEHRGQDMNIRKPPFERSE